MSAIFAHLVSTGVGPFYDGAAHFFMSIEEVLPVVALALLCGLRGTRASRYLLAILPVCWIGGGVIGVVGPALGLSVPLGVAAVLVPGGLSAMDRAFPLSLTNAVGVVLCLGLGYLNGTAMATAGAGWPAVFGAATSGLLTATLCAAAVVSIGKGKGRLMLRVLGSWMAAVGLLAIGWALRS